MFDKKTIINGYAQDSIRGIEKLLPRDKNENSLPKNENKKPELKNSKNDGQRDQGNKKN